MIDWLETDRLILRRWRTEDREPFAALNADPVVTEFLPGPMSRDASDALVERIEAHFNQHGYGLWAVERKDTGEMIGFNGLNTLTFEAHFTPAVEIGWRLARAHWGLGFTTEGARAALGLTFRDTSEGGAGLDAIVSITVPANYRSRNVMEKLGLIQDLAGNFDHPLVPDGHPLEHHVLYRMDRESWRPREPVTRA